MAKYRASYQIDTKSTTSEARKRKEQRKWKEEKRKRRSSQLSKTEEKEDALFSVPWEKSDIFESDIFGFPQLETVDCETLHLFTSKTDKACFRTTFALQIASPREATRLSGTSAPVGE